MMREQFDKKLVLGDLVYITGGQAVFGVVVDSEKVYANGKMVKPNYAVIKIELDNDKAIALRNTIFSLYKKDIEKDLEVTMNVQSKSSMGNVYIYSTGKLCNCPIYYVIDLGRCKYCMMDNHALKNKRIYLYILKFEDRDICDIPP